MNIQIHELNLTQDGNTIKESVPVIAVWVPARLGVAWINQDQPDQAD